MSLFSGKESSSESSSLSDSLSSDNTLEDSSFFLRCDHLSKLPDHLYFIDDKYRYELCKELPPRLQNQDWTILYDLFIDGTY